MEYNVKRSFSLIIEAFLKIRIAFVIHTKGKINNRNDSQHNQTSALPIFLPITKTLNSQSKGLWRSYSGFVAHQNGFCGSVRRRFPKALNSWKNTKGYVVSERFLSCHCLRWDHNPTESYIQKRSKHKPFLLGTVFFFLQKKATNSSQAAKITSFTQKLREIFL